MAGFVEGSRRLDNGTILIGKRTDEDRQKTRYLHGLFGGLSNSLIRDLEIQIERELPKSLREFFCCFNGLFMFGNSLSIRGLRLNSFADPLLSSWQPVSLRYGNTIEQPRELVAGRKVSGESSGMVRFASMNNAKSEAYILLNGDPTIYVSPRREMHPIIHKWPSLNSMLLSEAERMTGLIRKRGLDYVYRTILPPPWIDQDCEYVINEGWVKKVSTK